MQNQAVQLQLPGWKEENVKIVFPKSKEKYIKLF